MQISRGLILVDLSAVAPEPPPVGAIDLAAIPETLAEAGVASRKRYSTTSNWKYLRQLLWTAPELTFGGNDCSDVVEIGPLSFVALRGEEAALVRLSPRFPGHTDFEIVRLAPAGASASAQNGAGPIDEVLRQHGDAIAAAPLGTLNRRFYEWYWPLMSAAQPQ
jgi:hypothetical protein